MLEYEQHEVMVKLLQELQKKDSTHYDLIKAFKNCVLEFNWCDEKEFLCMLSEFPILENIVDKK